MYVHSCKERPLSALIIKLQSEHDFKLSGIYCSSYESREYAMFNISQDS